MDAGRGSYICGLVLGIAVGVAGTHVALSGRASAHVRLPDLSISSRIEAPNAPAEALLPNLTPELQTAFAPQPSTVHAIATAPAATETTIEPPRPLPVVDDAAPVPANLPHEDAELRAFIRDELQTLAASEHDIWYDTLRDLSREDATEILRIWKLTRGVESGPISPELKQFAALPIEKLVPHPPVADKAPATWQTQSPHTAQNEFRRLCELNLANAVTPGFKRREMMVFEQAIAAHADAPTKTRFAKTWINVSQGSLEKTLRLLDCAVDGQGFFQVKRENETCLTRCGRFVLDDERRIALPRSHGAPCPLEPAITVPKDFERLQILDTGDVGVVVKGGSTQHLGTISLVSVLDPASLAPVGDNLFQVTAGSGPAAPVAEAERGLILQGVIEESNVDPAAERRKLDVLSVPTKSL